jgi:hypothetical protein
VKGSEESTLCASLYFNAFLPLILMDTDYDTTLPSARARVPVNAVNPLSRFSLLSVGGNQHCRSRVCMAGQSSPEPSTVQLMVALWGRGPVTTVSFPPDILPPIFYPCLSVTITFFFSCTHGGLIQSRDPYRRRHLLA